MPAYRFQIQIPQIRANLVSVRWHFGSHTGVAGKRDKAAVVDIAQVHVVIGFLAQHPGSVIEAVLPLQPQQTTRSQNESGTKLCLLVGLALCLCNWVLDRLNLEGLARCVCNWVLVRLNWEGLAGIIG